MQQAHPLIAAKIGALRARPPEESKKVRPCELSHAAIVTPIRDGRVTQAQRTLAAPIGDTLESYRAAVETAVTAAA